MGSYVKRLMIANTLFGDADYQQQRFSALVNAEEKRASGLCCSLELSSQEL